MQVTFDPEVHPQIVALLAPLTRWQRKERIVALVYQGMGAEVSRNADAPQRLHPGPDPPGNGSDSQVVRPPVGAAAFAALALQPQIVQAGPDRNEPAPDPDPAGADDGIWRPQVEGDVFEALGLDRGKT